MNITKTTIMRFLTITTTTMKTTITTTTMKNHAKKNTTSLALPCGGVLHLVPRLLSNVVIFMSRYHLVLPVLLVPQALLLLLVLLVHLVRLDQEVLPVLPVL